MSKRSKSEPSMELSLEQLDTVIGGSGPAPMGLGGSASPAASDPMRTHGDPFATRATGGHIPFIPIDHALPPAPVGGGGDAPFGLGGTGTHGHPADTASADTHAVTADHIVASTGAHDPSGGPAGLGGGWQPDPSSSSTATTATAQADDHHEALAGDLFVPPVDAEPFATDAGAHADGGPVGLGWNGNS